MSPTADRRKVLQAAGLLDHRRQLKLIYALSRMKLYSIFANLSFADEDLADVVITKITFMKKSA